MILVVTNSSDATVGFAESALDSTGARWWRLDTDRYPEHIRLTMGTDASVLCSGSTRVDLGAVTSVWWRRPIPPRVPRDDAALAAWSAQEAYAALDGALRAIDARWVNHPDRNRVAQDKPGVLRRAARVGLPVPAWCVTNNERDARAFAGLHAGGVVLKAVRTAKVDDRRTLFTSRLEDLSVLERIGPEPCFLQAFIDKATDVRVIVVDQRLFAFEIDSQAEDGTRVDVRTSGLRSLAHREVPLSDALVESILELRNQLGLQFAAIDFAVDHYGTYWFLEINPNGQWAWLEELTQAPLAESLAHLLASA